MGNWREGRGKVAGPGDTGPVVPGEVLNFNLSTGSSLGRIEGKWQGKTRATSQHRPTATGQWSSQVLAAPCLLPPCPPASASSPSPMMPSPHLRRVCLLGWVLGCLVWISDSAGTLSKQCDSARSAATLHTALGVRANPCPGQQAAHLTQPEAQPGFRALPGQTPPHPNPLAPPSGFGWTRGPEEVPGRDLKEHPALMCGTSCSLPG